MQLSPFPCHLVPLRSKYFPQHPILKHPQPAFLHNVSDQVSHPYKTTGKIIVLCIVIFKFFDNANQTTKFNFLTFPPPPPFFCYQLYGPKDNLITPKTKMTSVKTIMRFLILRRGCHWILKANLWCPTRSALAARQNFGRGVAAQQLRVRNMVGGRVNSVNTGFGSFGKDVVSLGEWFLKFRKNSAVIFKRQPSMTKVLRSFETSRTAHSTTHRNLPGDSNLRKDRCENVITCDVSTHYNVN